MGSGRKKKTPTASAAVSPSIRVNNQQPEDDDESPLLNKNGGSSSAAGNGGGGQQQQQQRRRSRPGGGGGGGGLDLLRGCCSSLSSWCSGCCCSSDQEETYPYGRRRGGNNWDRFVLLLLLSGFVAVSVYYQSEIRGIRSELGTEHSRVEKLTDLLGVHESVIERFNSSVTNTDVMSRLAALETSLANTTADVRHQLERVSVDISEQLNQTLEQLSRTVSDAEETIGREVDKVKEDVEQYVVTTQAQFSMENSFMVYQLAGTFTLLSCLISMWHMTAHLRKMNQPDVQRKILAILWMPPIYAVTSWFSLVFPQAEGWLAIIKDGYEAYIIYQFLAFLIAVLGKGDRGAVVDLLSRHADHLTPPFRLFGCFEICGCCVPEPYESSRALADAILLQCQVFALQFVFFRPVTTMGMVLCKQFDYYGAGDGPTDYRSPQFYLTIVQNVSIFVAFAGLLKFYHAVDADLAWCRPFAKFLCIKGVVFMTFWQGLAISVLAETTDVGGENKNAEDWGKSAQNFLICLEMLLFSIAHFYCFPTDEWEEGYKIKHSPGFGDTVALGDFMSDIKLILRSSSNPKKKKKKPDHQPATIPEASDEDTGELTEEVVSLATSSEEFDVEKAVAEALEESLGLCGHDPDIIEAKKRLLESKVLSPEFFDVSEGEHYTFIDYDEEEESVHGKDDDDEESGNRKEEENTDEEAPTETTPLRPSIFTTVASIAEKEAKEAEAALSGSGNDERSSATGVSEDDKDK